jgi:hypothetical protein
VTRLTFAYLDPGSSSMIVQMFLGGLAAVGVALKLYWRRLMRFLHLRKDDDAEEAGAVNVAKASSANGAAPAEREPVETTKR